LRISFVFGTRPEIIKLSALLNLSASHHEIELETIHTGQHYNYHLSQSFLEDLNLPQINYEISVGSLPRLEQIRQMVFGLEKVLKKRKPDVVVVQGDTNSTLAGAIAARNFGIPIAHVEAGLRCFDEQMVEEINRKATDRISSIWFAPTPQSVHNLKQEGIQGESVILAGNTIVEVAIENLKIAKKKSRILQRLGLKPGSYILITAHRQENVDNEKFLADLISAWEQIHLQMVYPVHPRTQESFIEFGLIPRLNSIKNLMLLGPLSYWDFLLLASSSRMIMTDSGGIQEECTIYKKPVIVIREYTERPEIIGTFGVLTGNNSEKILCEVKNIDANYQEIITRLKKTPSPFGDGKASERIVSYLLKKFT